jgi:hypothetical protein
VVEFGSDDDTSGKRRENRRYDNTSKASRGRQSPDHGSLERSRRMAANIEHLLSQGACSEAQRATVQHNANEDPGTDAPGSPR